MESGLKKIAENIFAQAAEALFLNKQAQSAYFILKEDEILEIPVLFRSIQDKEKVSLVVNGFCRKVDADALFFISETWVVVRTKDDIPGDCEVSKEPDRQERLMVIFSDGYGKGDMLSAVILRDNEGNPHMEKSEWASTGEMVGRMLMPWKSGSVQ